MGTEEQTIQGGGTSMLSSTHVGLSITQVIVALTSVGYKQCAR